VDGCGRERWAVVYVHVYVHAYDDVLRRHASFSDAICASRSLFFWT